MSFSTFFTTTLTIAAFLVKQSIAGYTLQDDYTPQNFFSMFEFFTAPDPTNGFVQYLDQSAAQSGGLISNDYNSVMMGVDHTNMAPNGRSSVRLTSNKVYNQGLIILDVAHMPEGCGTWPAFWTTGPDWPNNGEIDIIEGVNDQAQNAMTLHTGPSCSITNNGLFSGTIGTTNCDVNDPDQPTNAGCSIDADGQSNTYGSGLNAIHGGIYATEWTSSGISTYFFPRSSIPADITSGTPNPAGWGKPLAMFTGGCDINNSIKNQQIVFDTTFCGDWAGEVWSTSSTCAAKATTCNDFVVNNPEAFVNAYWEVNSLKVYQNDGSSDPNTPAATSTNAGPTGIASGLPSVLSSVAPIPAVTSQTTFATSVLPLSSIGGWSKAPGAHAPAVTSTVAVGYATDTAATTAAPSISSIMTSPAAVVPISIATAAPAITTLSTPPAAATTSPAAATTQTSSSWPWGWGWHHANEPYQAGDPVPAAWLEGEGIPADAVAGQSKKGRRSEERVHARHIFGGHGHGKRHIH